jgi:hypothetical protein
MFQKRDVDKIGTHILFAIDFFPENRAVCEIKWKNTVQPDRPQMTTQCFAKKIRFTCQMTRARNIKYYECVSATQTDNI